MWRPTRRSDRRAAEIAFFDDARARVAIGLRRAYQYEFSINGSGVRTKTHQNSYAV